MAGTYDTTTQGAGWYINCSLDKAVTIESYTSTVEIDTANSYGAVRCSVASTKRVEIKDLSVTRTVGNRWVYMDAAAENDLVFEDCDFDPSININLINTAQSDNLLRRVTFTRCNYSQAGTAPAIDIYGAAYIGIIETNLKDTNDTSYGLIKLRGRIGSLDCRGGTWESGGSGFYLRDSNIKYIWQASFIGIQVVMTAASGVHSGIKIAVNNVRNLIVKDCEIYSTATSGASLQGIDISAGSSDMLHSFTALNNHIYSANVTAGIGIVCGTGCTGTVNRNTIHDLRTGIFTDSYISCENNLIYETSTCIFMNGINANIRNNTLVASDRGVSDSRCLLANRKTHVAQSNSTTFTSTRCTWGNSPDLSSIREGMLVFAAASTGYEFSHYGVVTEVNNSSDYVTVVQWVKTSDDTIDTPANGLYAAIVTYPDNIVVDNNIMDGRDALYTMTFDYDPRAQNKYIDYNCYVSGMNTMTNLARFLAGHLDSDNLVEHVASWDAFLETAPNLIEGNDTHSLEADPQFRDPDNGDFMPTNPLIYSAGINGGAIGAVNNTPEATYFKLSDAVHVPPKGIFNF